MAANTNSPKNKYHDTIQCYMDLGWIWDNLVQNAKLGWWVAILWLIGYNGIGHLTKKRAKVLPDNWMTALDKRIPQFEPVFDVFYSLGFGIALYPLFFIEDRGLAIVVLASYGVTLIISFVIFLTKPIRIERPPAKYLIMKVVQKFDSPSNCLPSVHCSMAVLPFLISLAAMRPEWPVVGAVAFGICASTVFTKQHYLIDSITGIMLAVVVFAGVYLVVI